MKRALLFLALLFVVPLAHAGEPVSLTLGHDSRYESTNGTLAVSSFSAASFPAVEGYRRLKLAPTTSFFYTIDGTSSSATVVSSGYPALAAGTTPNADIVIESNRLIAITLPAGIAATTLRYELKTK